MASRPGAAPGRLSFGDSAAQAGARLKKTGNWCGCRELHPDILRGGEVFWLLNHSRKESKRAGSVLFHTPGPRHFNKEQTPLAIWFQIPTHGFTVVLSVFWGTPPAKPLNCKSASKRLGARIRSVWAHHTGGTPRHSSDRFRLALSDIIKTSFSFHSQFRFPFVLIVHRHLFRQQKTLLTFR